MQQQKNVFSISNQTREVEDFHQLYLIQKSVLGEHSSLKYPRDSDSMPSFDFKLFKNLNERHIKFQRYTPHFFIRVTSGTFLLPG